MKLVNILTAVRLLLKTSELDDAKRPTADQEKAAKWREIHSEFRENEWAHASLTYVQQKRVIHLLTFSFSSFFFSLTLAFEVGRFFRLFVRRLSFFHWTRLSRNCI